jgi:hypothetical protein
LFASAKFDGGAAEGGGCKLTQPCEGFNAFSGQPSHGFFTAKQKTASQNI